MYSVVLVPCCFRVLWALAVLMVEVAMAVGAKTNALCNFCRNLSARMRAYAYTKLLPGRVYVVEVNAM